MKKFFIVTLVLLCLGLVSNCNREDTTQLAKDEFEKYDDGKNEVSLISNNTIHFEKNQIDLDLLKHNGEPNNGVLIRDDKIYYTTSAQSNLFDDYTLNIYQANLYGTEVELIFSKDGYKTHPWVYEKDNCFYVEHFLKNAFIAESKQIDKFSIDSEEYDIVASGKECNISDYIHEEKESQYNIELAEQSISPKMHGKFVITDSKTGAKRIIDDDYLKNTIYFESMDMFNYDIYRFDISKGHILLTYSIGAGDGWNYPHLVFEYDFEKDALEYKMLAFPSDNMGVDIRYIK